MLYATRVALAAVLVGSVSGDDSAGTCTVETCVAAERMDVIRYEMGEESYTDADKARSQAAVPGINFDMHGYPTGSIMGASVANYQTYVPEAGDLWITSWPKSGTNWVKNIVQMILLRGDEVAITEFENSGVDLSTKIPLPDVMPIDYGAMERPRAFFTHFRKYVAFPFGLKAGAKIINVVRDPQAASASLLPYMSPLDFGFGKHYVNMTIDDVAKLTMDGLNFYGPWEKHVKSYMAGNDPNVLFLFYEDLKQDLAAGAARIAKFMGKDLSEAQLKTVVEKSSFAYMKKREALIQGKEWIESIGAQATQDYTLVATGESSGKKYSPEVAKLWKTWWETTAFRAVGVNSYDKLRKHPRFHQI